MATAERRQLELREKYAVSLYGLDASYRSEDELRPDLLAVCGWAVEASGYDDASIDVFTGNGPLTLVGRTWTSTTYETVHAALTRDPQQRWHVLNPFPARADDPGRPLAWAGSPLLTPAGAVLGGLDLWSSAAVPPDDRIGERLPILARAVMNVLDQQRRILTSRSVVPPGPRSVVPRSSGTCGPG